MAELSNPLTIVVQDPPAPAVYEAAGATAVAVYIESPLAAATRPRTRRLTHADQTSRYSTDQFLKFSNPIAQDQYTFFTKSKLRAG